MIALATVILATAEGEEPSRTDLLIPVFEELIAGIIAFAIVFFVIWRFAAPAFRQMLDNRQQAITSQLQEAEKAKTEAASLLEDYKAQLAGARTEANRIIEEARRASETLRTDLVAKAEAEGDEIIRRAREEAQGEKQRALEEAREQVASLALELAERIVRASIDREVQRELVETYLADLEGMAQ